MTNNIASTEEYVINASIFKVGKVVEITGRTVKVKVDTGKNATSVLYNGELIQNISVGGYIKIKKGLEEMIGKIDSETVSENRGKSKTIYSSNREIVSRVINIKILGFIDKGVFKRGIKELPLIDNDCYLLTRKEFSIIHNFIQKNDESIRIGSLEYDNEQVIQVGVNSLFASHIGIFGNTGSGKSYTLAQLYRQLFEQYKMNPQFIKRTKFFFLDFNGEYTEENVMTNKKHKCIYNLSTQKTLDNIQNTEKFPVHTEIIEDSSFWSIFLEATEKTQMPFLNRALKDSYLSNQLSQDSYFAAWLQEKILEATATKGKDVDRSLTVDMLYEVGRYLDNESIRDVANYFRRNLFGGGVVDFYLEESGNFPSNPIFASKVGDQINGIKKININSYSDIKKLGLRIVMKYYDEMIRGFANKEHLSPLLKRLEKRIDDLDKVLTTMKEANAPQKNIFIVSLRDVNLSIRKMLPMLLVKEMYDQKKKDNNKDHSLHIIIDEAHNILSENSDRESAQWKDYRLEMFEEIIKEGRKFATFLTVSSQRPSDISPTIISQLHNYFLHRLINNKDLQAVERTIAYLDKVSADSIPNLPTGVCIMAGLFAQIPVVISIDAIENLENQPQSQNINLIEKWKS